MSIQRFTCLIMQIFIFLEAAVFAASLSETVLSAAAVASLSVECLIMCF